MSAHIKAAMVSLPSAVKDQIVAHYLSIDPPDWPSVNTNDLWDNVPDSALDAALVWAAGRGLMSVVERLLTKGARVSHEALLMAILSNNWHVAYALCKPDHSLNLGDVAVSIAREGKTSNGLIWLLQRDRAATTRVLKALPPTAVVSFRLLKADMNDELIEQVAYQYATEDGENGNGNGNGTATSNSLVIQMATEIKRG